MTSLAVARRPGVRRRTASRRLLGPAAAFYLAFFVAPILILFAYSLFQQQGFNVVPDVTLSNYLTGVTTASYAAVLVRTLLVGIATASVVVPIAYVLSYLMLFVFSRRAQFLLNLVLVSMFSGYLVRIYAWRTILGRDGLLNAILIQLGVVKEPLTFLIFSSWAVIITLVELLIPLALLPVFSAMSNVSKEHVEVARDLGSSGFRLHRTILVPMVLPGLSVAFALSFILAAGDFVVPQLIGGSQGIMVGNIIADQFKGLGYNWPLGSALAFLVMGIVIAVYLGLIRLVRLATR
ncbi:MAG: ABC transporter permease [Chloroflexi bacterium]|nr:ABC transporter permease [Chloroflexota bacterium]